MTRRVVDFHPEAIAEGREARLWYRLRSQMAEERFRLGLRRAIASIRKAPQRWPADADGLRQCRLSGSGIGRDQARCSCEPGFLIPPFKPCVPISGTRLTDNLPLARAHQDVPRLTAIHPEVVTLFEGRACVVDAAAKALRKIEGEQP